MPLALVCYSLVFVSILALTSFLFTLSLASFAPFLPPYSFLPTPASLLLPPYLSSRPLLPLLPPFFFCTVEASQIIEDCRHALYAAKICSYAQGMCLIQAASDQVREVMASIFTHCLSVYLCISLSLFSLSLSLPLCITLSLSPSLYLSLSPSLYLSLTHSLTLTLPTSKTFFLLTPSPLLSFFSTAPLFSCFLLLPFSLILISLSPLPPSTQLSWDIDLSECARIWRGGCIIRAVKTLLPVLYSENHRNS
jgi:6-phosphogluconate dehydrogenase, C-terminal domain